MVTIGYLIIATAAFACLVWCWRAYRAQPSTMLLLILIPLLGLWFDSFAVAMGRFAGEGPILTAMTYIRFGAHWTTLPLLFIVAGMIARRAGFRWAQPKPVMALFCIAAVYFICEDVPHLWQVEFHPACYAETLRLVTRVAPTEACTPADAGIGARVSSAAAIGANLLLMLIGFGLWWKHRFPWLALGCGTMFVAAAIPQSIVGPMLGNAGEPIFNAALIYAGIRFARPVAAPAVSVAAAQ